jgi:predicted ATPase
MERVSTEPQTHLRYFCSPQHTDSALYPIISQMERAARFAHDDTAQAKLDKLEALLAQSLTPRQNTALLADMLSLRNDGRYPTLELDPQQRRQRTMEALTGQLEALSQIKPVLMIFEDVHWVDPTSIEVLDRTVDRIKTLSVLLIITHRPEFDPPWIGTPYVTALLLNRLGEREIDAMIDRVAGDTSLPATLRQDIIERTDGVPLFIEEMTKAVVEAGVEKAGAQVAAVVPSPAVAVPASLHASLMARLDRLGPAKEVAQIGAVIGREFSYALLAIVSRKDETQLNSALDGLVLSGLLFRQGLPPYANYLFKHALVQDAAYGTLLREPRRALHARIAESIETHFTDIAESQPELLARHCTKAGLIEKAAHLWGKAGQRSLERSALAEAAEQFKRALDQIAALPSTPTLRREEIKLQVALIAPLIHVQGYAAPKTREAADRARILIERAEALGESPNDPLLLLSVLYSIWVANFVSFDGDAIRELATQFMSLAEKQRSAVAILIGHRLIGNSRILTGEMIEGRARYDQAFALGLAANYRPLATRFGQDIQVATLSFRSLVLWLLGYPEAALADGNAALKDAREIGNAATLMYALNHATMFARILCGRYSEATTALKEVVTLAEEKGASFWKALGILNQASVLSLTGKGSDAIQMFTTGMALYRTTGATIWKPLHLTHLASAYSQLGQFDDAWRSISEAMTVVEATKESWFAAELNRTAGEIALKLPEPDPVKGEDYFKRALAVSRQQAAKSWELRAAMSLARLWRDQGKMQEARGLLAPIYGWFTEGFETRDLQDAKVLHAELAS